MNFLNEKIDKKKVIIYIVVMLLLIIGSIIIYFYQNQYEEIDVQNVFAEIENVQKSQTEDNNKIDGNTNDVGNNVIEEKIAIHITGEVKNAGLIYLKKGARIADAIKEAGGSTKDAALDKVNLAYILEDGQKIHIPSKKEIIGEEAYIISNSGENVLVEEGKKTGNSTNMKGEGSKVNINSANQEELETLPGIGPALALRILEYRNENGKFDKIEDLQNVKGIGDAKFSNIKEYICI